MSVYLTEDDQNEMAILIYKYLELTHYSKIPPSRDANMILNKFFKIYADKLINGIIYNQKYQFWRHAEIDDLMQEGRLAILNSINKDQWDIHKGTIFNFFSTVVGRSLMNYTAKINRNAHKHSPTDIQEYHSDPAVAFIHDLDKGFIIDDLSAMLQTYFSGKPKFEHLSELLITYYKTHLGSKFVKKHFIEFAKAHNYSPSVVNVFFNALKNISYNKNLKEFIYIVLSDFDNIN